ncbi:hypothetical protein CSKR_109543 [Clonorchis sinensis]|uniref:Uncharacterized protein n=1 Tax=Clonorchis sinensis TaxID=79923 RepID=A0A3R7JNA3_CLOSI|nr:hypothetical protein CSKR_109543 [Clonorchis sinensis]
MAQVVGARISSEESPWFEPLPVPLDFPCLGLGSRLAASQPSCFPRVTWQLGTERVLQPNDFTVVSTSAVKSVLQTTHQQVYRYGGARWRKWLEREFTDHKVRGSNPTCAFRLPSCLGLGNLAVSQPSCFPWVAWPLGTEGVIQRLNSFNIWR